MNAEVPKDSSANPEREIPRVSIVLLSWNQERYISACVQSIAAQTFTDYEIVAIDNGSSDGSGDLLAAELERLDARVTLIRNSSNVGIPRALNQALALISGDCVVPFAADDVMLHTRLAEQVGLLDHCDDTYAAVCGDLALIDGNGDPLLGGDEGGSIIKTPWFANEEQQLENIIAGRTPLAPSAMFRASVYSNVGFYDESIPIEDYDYWLRISQRFRILYRPGVVALYRRHGANATDRGPLMRDAVHESLVRIDPLTLKPDERKALDVRLRDVRFRRALDGMAGALPDCRQRLLPVVRDSGEHTGRRLRAAIALLNPKLVQKLLAWRRPG